MSPQPSYGRSRDHNERAIVATFEGAGWLVQRLDAWDLCVLCPSREHILAVEVKIPKHGPGTAAGRLTASQERLIDAGWPLHVIHSVNEAMMLVKLHRAQAHPTG